MARRNDAKTDTIAAGAFKACCLELMDRVREKKVEYVITKHGRPVAKLVPACPLVTADRRIVDYARREKKVELSVVEAR